MYEADGREAAGGTAAVDATTEETEESLRTLHLPAATGIRAVEDVVVEAAAAVAGVDYPRPPCRGP